MGLATAVAITTSLASAGASAKQASNASGFAKEANAKAKIAFDKAMKELSANKLAGISLPMESYERQIEAARGAGAELTRAGQESERGAAAIAGQVYRGQTEAQREIAGDMAQQLIGLETATAEEANLSRARANLNLAEAEGAQAAAAQFGAQQDAAIKGAFSALGEAGQQYLQGSELYKKSKGVKEFEKLSEYAQKKGMTQEDFQKSLVELSKSDPRFANLSGAGYSATGVDAQGKPITGLMTPMTLKDYMGGLGKDYNKSLYEAFTSRYPGGIGQPISIAPTQGVINPSTTRFGQNIVGATQSPFQQNVNFQLPYYLGF